MNIQDEHPPTVIPKEYNLIGIDDHGIIHEIFWENNRITFLHKKQNLALLK